MYITEKELIARFMVRRLRVSESAKSALVHCY